MYNAIPPDLTNGAPVYMWNEFVKFDPNAIDQLMNLASMPFIYKHVAAMPDAHFGMGATIGSVIATKGAIIPAAVGVDLGCGMVAAKLNLTASDLPESLHDMRMKIEEWVPAGGPGVKGSWAERGRRGMPPEVDSMWNSISQGYHDILAKHPKIKGGLNAEQLGTLGTGNHFVEVCLDLNNNVWIMLHSGSRGVGNRIASYFIEEAKKDMRKWFINLPDMNLAYIPTGSPMFGDYWEAISWAQNYAKASRQLMLYRTHQAIVRALGRDVAITDTVIDCHHNYVAAERHYGENVLVTRKGAVKAAEGDYGIIPGSMGACSYIVKGLGNRESFNSCSHGAGRVMSRTEARKLISVERHEAATSGVECRKDADVLDESPDAYKDIRKVMDSQADLVTPVETLRQVLCVKG